MYREKGRGKSGLLHEWFSVAELVNGLELLMP